MKRGVTVEQEATASQLPELSPVLVATDDEGVEELIRAARADVARLSLALRSVRHRADTAARRAADAESCSSDFDPPAARELLRSSLEVSIEARRRDLTTELEQARADATRVVASAQRRADAYVASAQSAAMTALLQPGQPLAPLPPLPPAVDPDENALPVFLFRDEAPAPQLVPAAHERSPSADQATAVGFASILAALQPLIAGQSAPPVAPSASAGAPAPVLAPPTPKPPRPSLASRLLFADVLLPLIAVVVIVIVLLAWVG